MSSKKISFNISLLKSLKMLMPLFSVFLWMIAFNSSALETSLQVHKATQSGAYGVSVGIGDNFFSHSDFNWAVSYNRLEDINIIWDNEDIKFAIDTIDLVLSYRYYPRSYNRFVKSLIVEFQAGVGVAVTENKLVWSELNEEKYFSQQGDINGMLGLAVYKKFTKQLAMQLGVKHYPSYSEFGDISSVYLGVNYTFGRQSGY